MSKTLDTIERTAPAYWASYLINGDASGLEDSEQAECDAWVKTLEPYQCAIDCSEPEFRTRSDASNLGGDVCTYTFANYGRVHVSPAEAEAWLERAE